MVSLPDDLLSQVDNEAERTGTSRSAVLRNFADTALARRRTSRADAMKNLLAGAGRHGGRTAEMVRSTRPA